MNLAIVQENKRHNTKSLIKTKFKMFLKVLLSNICHLANNTSKKIVKPSFTELYLLFKKKWTFPLNNATKYVTIFVLNASVKTVFNHSYHNLDYTNLQ